MDDANGAPGRARVSFAEAGATARAVLLRATRATPPLSAGEWRVLSAVVALVLTYSRLEDHLRPAQVAQCAGVSLRWVQRLLPRLASRELLIYEPGRGQGRVSVIRFPKVNSMASPFDDGKGELQDATFPGGEKVNDQRAKGERSARKRRTPGVHPSEKTSEKTSKRARDELGEIRDALQRERFSEEQTECALARLAAAQRNGKPPRSPLAYARKIASSATDEEIAAALGEIEATREREENARRRKTCTRCDPNGFVVDAEGAPLEDDGRVLKCSHDDPAEGLALLTRQLSAEVASEEEQLDLLRQEEQALSHNRRVREAAGPDAFREWLLSGEARWTQ